MEPPCTSTKQVLLKQQPPQKGQSPPGRGEATPAALFLVYFPQYFHSSSTKSTRLSFLGSCPALFLKRSEQEVGKRATLSHSEPGLHQSWGAGACTLGEGVKDTGETAISSDLALQFSKAPLAGRDSGLLPATPILLLPLLNNKQQCLRPLRSLPSTNYPTSFSPGLPNI